MVHPIPNTLAERGRIQERCKYDRLYRQAILDQCRVGKDDPVEQRVAAIHFFINTFIWTIDPRNPEEGPKPLFLYKVQVDKIIVPLETAVMIGEDHWWEKSRGVGFTWVYLAWGFHGWMLRPGWQGLLGSYEEALVDDRTAFSHFGKIDFLMSWLPEWMLPEEVPGFVPRQHRQFLKLDNPNTRDLTRRGNILQGDSASARFGRGGRFLWCLFDEAGHWMNLAASMAAASQTAGSRFGGSTANGSQTYWGRWVKNPANQHRLTRIHWSEVDGLDDAWYQRQCDKLVDPAMIAQELDISYTGSVSGRVYPTWDAAIFEPYDWEPAWPLFLSWDFGLDKTALIWWQRNPVTGFPRMLDCFAASQKPLDYYVPFVTGELPSPGSALSRYALDYSVDEVAKITIHATWGQGIHFGDPTGRNRSVSTGESPVDILAKHGIYVHINDAARVFDTRKRMTERSLAGLEVNIPNEYGPIGCWGVDEAMRTAHYPRRNPDAETTVGATLPVHDDSSHFRTAVEYFFASVPPHRADQRPRFTRRSRGAAARLIR